MDWHMGRVLPGLYVGNYRDSKDQQQLDKFQITHIIAIHDSPRRLLPDKHYLCVMAADTPDQNLSQYFSVCNDFIHAARLRDGNVLIHCLAGMSRSVTVAVAYIMTATNLNWKEALKVVRAGRAVANPNAGFQSQLQEFEAFRLFDERRRLRERFPSNALEQSDRSKCVAALDNYQELLMNKDICEGNCSRGEKCPTGAVMLNFNKTHGILAERDDIDRSDSMGYEGIDFSSGTSSSSRQNSNRALALSYTLSFAVAQWKAPLQRKSASLSKINELKALNLDEDDGEEIMPNVLYFAPIVDPTRQVVRQNSDLFIESIRREKTAVVKPETTTTTNENNSQNNDAKN